MLSSTSQHHSAAIFPTAVLTLLSFPPWLSPVNDIVPLLLHSTLSE